MLPTAFLRQLIGFYGGSLQGVVPRYLEQALATFTRQQVQVRHAVQQTIGPFLPPGIEEISRQNLAMIERAMGLFNPFVPPRDPASPQADSAPFPVQEPNGPARTDLAAAAELERLRGEVESLRSQLAVARADAAPAQGAEGPPSISADDLDSPVKSGSRGQRRAG